MTIKAIYENGVFRPTEPVDLPDRTAVDIKARVIEEEESPEGAAARRETMKILSRRYNSGQHDVAERHNEHQP